MILKPARIRRDTRLKEEGYKPSAAAAAAAAMRRVISSSCTGS
jgi:hypothetical protein